MYNSFVNVAKEGKLTGAGRVDERLFAVYDANCVNFVNATTNATDDCLAIKARAICERAPQFAPSTTSRQLQALCEARSDYTAVTYYSFTNIEICAFVESEACLNETEIADAGSFASTFCSGFSLKSAILGTLQSKCREIAVYDSCVSGETRVFITQGVFVAITMFLYALADSWYCHLDGDVGEREVKRLFVKAALKKKNKAKWLSKWHAVFTETVGHAGAEKDVMLAAFAAFAALKRSGEHCQYCAPAEMAKLRHKIQWLVLMYVLFLEIDLGVIIYMMMECSNGVDTSQLVSVFLFGIAFLCYAITLLLSVYCRRHKKRASTATVELMCDKSVQAALLSGNLALLTRKEEDEEKEP
jgi:hypothetical protein